MRTSNKNLIEDTKKEFQSFYESEISEADAYEIINNFTGLAKLLLKLDEKRQKALKEEKNRA